MNTGMKTDDQLLELVRVSRANDDPRCLFRATTLYRWHTQGRMPELFVKIAGTLFVKANVLREKAIEGGNSKGSKTGRSHKGKK
jgi:hypothetical protein